MPTYMYRCTACGHSFEQYQSISAEPIRLCPACGQAQVQRVVTGGSGLIFKGSGFYSTDYKRGGSTEKAKPEAAEKPAEKTAEKET